MIPLSGGGKPSRSSAAAAGAGCFCPPDQVLMEIKLTRACPLWLCRLLSELALYPTSFSKYGACYRQMLLTADPDPLTKEAHFCA